MEMYPTPLLHLPLAVQSSGEEIPSWLWAAFGGIVVVLLALDLWSYRGHSEKDTRRKDFLWTIAWIGVSILFGGFLWYLLGLKMAAGYFAAYAMEKGLSMDNVFLFFVIFKSLNIAKEHQHRVLFWGILGAVVFRGVFIFLGVRALERWEWVTYIFAAILVYAAYKAFTEGPDEEQESRTLNWLSTHLPVEKKSDGGGFLVSTSQGKAATPLLVALLAIEITDIMFAVDSVPAALSVTHNTFLVYSSNIFAILGLRALYLYFASQIGNLRYLHYGLSAVLLFAAAKILTQELFEIPALVSAGVVVLLVGGSIWASLRRDGKK